MKSTNQRLATNLSFPNKLLSFDRGVQKLGLLALPSFLAPPSTDLPFHRPPSYVGTQCFKCAVNFIFVFYICRLLGIPLKINYRYIQRAEHISTHASSFRCPSHFHGRRSNFSERKTAYRRQGDNHRSLDESTEKKVNKGGRQNTIPFDLLTFLGSTAKEPGDFFVSTTIRLYTSLYFFVPF